MKGRLKYLIIYFLFWLFFFIIQKPLFLLFQYQEWGKHSIIEYLQVCWNGISMDISTAGYLSIVVAVILLISCFTPTTSWVKSFCRKYTYATLIIVCLIIIADLFLYRYWGFRIDDTPLFYLKSPKEAFASGSLFEYFIAIVLFALLIGCTLKIYTHIDKKIAVFTGLSWGEAIPLLLLIGFLFVGIRGGIGVSTMNTGFVYFSDKTFLNHAAINPAWNFFQSLIKSSDFKARYHYMSKHEAELLIKKFENKKDHESICIIKNKRPNIILLIMEGIGSNAIESLNGAKGATPNIDQLIGEGVFFNNFYANSFRTDRGLMSILGAYPAQPTTSIMKFPQKTESIMSIPAKLKENGYNLSFYYGGDANFTNLNSFLRNSGYTTIISEKDFSKNELSTKWGAYDHILFNRVKEDLGKREEKPFFKTILTLNSHEPFDVPTKKLKDPYLNSVFYADSCIGDFVSFCKKSDFWENSLIIILPDHCYKYPYSIENSNPYRYKIPMIWTGGVVNSIEKIESLGSQIDLAATLFSQLDIDTQEFSFSKNILQKNYSGFAYYSFIDGFGLITPNDTAIFDCAANYPIHNSDSLIPIGKAYLQLLYEDFSKR